MNQTILAHEDKYVGPTAMFMAFEQIKKTKGVPPVVILPRRKKERAMKESNDIADLLSFSVPEMTPEQLEVEKRKAEERKANTQALADKIVKAKAELEKIEAIPDWDMNPGLVSQHDEMLAFLDKVGMAGDEAFKASLAVSALINRIKAINPQSDAEVEAELRNVANKGRGELMSAKEVEEEMKIAEKLPEGAIKFKSVCLLHKKSKIHPDKIASPADQTIFRELRNMISRYSKSADSKKKEDLKKGGNHNLADLKAKKSGLYRIHFPEIKEEKKGKTIHWEEGVALIECKNNGKVDQPYYVIKVVDGAGSLRWLADHKGQWVPWAALLTGRVVEEKTPAEYLEFAKRFAKALNKALYLFEKGSRG